MQIRFALQPLGRSIFLAGPTPRSANTASWRPEALSLLNDLGFTGTVLVPETPQWGLHEDYSSQLHWEWEALNQATVVAFWVPRVIRTMPAFTSNVEFGMLAASAKVLLGFPPAAEKMRYLTALARRHQVPVFHTLKDLLTAAVTRTTQPFGLV